MRRRASGDAIASPTTYNARGWHSADRRQARRRSRTYGVRRGRRETRGKGRNAKRTSKAGAGEVVEHTDEAAARRLLREAREAEARRLDDAGSHTPAKPPHGNRIDDRPATLYEKLDKDEGLLKHGITTMQTPPSDTQEADRRW